MSTNEADEQIDEDTMITAIHSFNGTRTHTDLNFEHGDVMRLICVIENDPSWGIADLRGKQGFIPINYVKPIRYFHGKITREQAEFLLKDKEEGAYLIRESIHYKGDYTLCLKSSSKIEHYHIKHKSSTFFIDDEQKFPNLLKLVAYYTEIPELASLLKTALYLDKQQNDD